MFYYIIQHCYPSLYDNRDFLYLIPKYNKNKENDSKEQKIEKYNITKIILEDIPNLIIKYYKRFIEEKKICLTIGEYKMNYSYYINDFLENNDIYWCRCLVNRHFSYIIISDMYFIILHIINEKKVNLIWEEDPLLKDIQYKQEIVFENTINLNEFNDKINKKKNKLFQLFTQFDDDEIRNSPSSILRMINYYEILFEKIKSKILEKINNNQKHDKDINDGLYFKNILIIYYKKALNLYCLENKIKEKFNERLMVLYSDKIIK